MVRRISCPGGRSSSSAGGIGGGGIGGGANAVACDSSYVYWTEIAARLNGSAGSVFRTDVVAKNNGNAMANLTFYLHAEGNLFDGPGSVDAGAQGEGDGVGHRFGLGPRRLAGHQ